MMDTVSTDGGRAGLVGAGWKQVQMLASTTLNASAANQTQATLTGLGAYTQAMFALKVTDKKDAAADTCDLYLDTSPDGGTSWFNVGHFTQLLGNGTDADTEIIVLNSAATPGTSAINVTSDAGSGVSRPAMFCDRIRLRSTTVKDGATGEFTFSVEAFFKAA